MAQWYTTADVFVNPTVGDNFPTVNLEAMACGTPVVTFDTGGCGEAVGNYGIVIRQKDVSGMLQAINEVIEYKNKYNCMGKVKDFDKNEKYEEYLSLFEDTIRK